MAAIQRYMIEIESHEDEGRPMPHCVKLSDHTKPRGCARCLDSGWICAHCDRALPLCECPDNGSRNPALCAECPGPLLIDVHEGRNLAMLVLNAAQGIMDRECE